MTGLMLHRVGRTPTLTNPPVLTGVPAEAEKGSAYSFTPGMTGGTGAITYSLFSGTPPAGLSLNSSTGQVSGTPTTVENQTVTIRATDSLGVTGDLTVTIHVWGYIGVVTGSTLYSTGSNEIDLIPITTPAGGIIADKLRVSLKNSVATDQMRAVVYSETSSVPDAMLRSGTNTATGLGAGGGVVDLSLGSDLSLAGSTNFWIGAHNQFNTTDFNCVGSGPASRYQSFNAFGSPSPNPIGATFTFGSYIVVALHYRLQ